MINACKKKIKTILIIAGGSGGHVFPGLSVARYLMNHGYKVVWLGSKENIESQLVPRHGIDIKFIYMKGWRGKNIYKKLVTLLFLMFLSIYQALKIIKYWKPDIALSMGGYVAGPSSLAVVLCRIPLIIHEQNRVIGLTNRYLSFFAAKIFQGFPDVIANAITLGNPLRHTILSIPKPINRWKYRTGPIRVLVMGGSNGAYIFNKVVPKIFEQLFSKLIIWHQSGEKDFERVLKAYRKTKQKINYKITPFIDDIAQAYSWADVVISRSGALTVSEIIYVGLPAIFVPFPYHKDKQQYWNALPLMKLGSAIIVEQEKFTSDYISRVLESWNRKTLLVMAKRARSLITPNATKLVAQTIIQYLKEKKY
ncbi:UDP-N-acetylglucosamine-N-acetylmuramyl-(pentapeptide) pyrophosphoryl-undecaprenol N-acetylglucosamine transferase [Candidatus Blochmanniella vafra str. BVAF]|uniref:UDP-N-acetylglucosamine--N-acetylmuramyl-(pentapeptide) pyrophosphoryl-undecaprenol N-acetylglucosamine transferase n=1 Tax=Blochmanniella vafra (strain BVAF) TaxID=859654 RepID=E8Q5Q3_BLOVB|nr:undecaprenyldiphospho-muramoylpentapeptide beta-N-acetylglucosaminyltransferase [Candidatus Blochmannia vafer]ADV33550.1 UDP-N-acetylglucosamine-N-acetylmuramyl-(pentapeptide) pyrophosphoryl-undecaprenol N-acetylglucosamine transferase [Candidatus Blochmannia vafer str. BVAF]